MTDTYTPALTDADVRGIALRAGCDPQRDDGALVSHLVRLAERAAIEAYQRQQWRPIETAPQGTMLLMADMDAPEARNWAFVDWLADGKCCGNRYRTPTHWQPLPPAPTEAT